VNSKLGTILGDTFACVVICHETPNLSLSQPKAGLNGYSWNSIRIAAPSDSSVRMASESAADELRAVKEIDGLSWKAGPPLMAVNG
jgi:hypothetical protein